MTYTTRRLITLAAVAGALAAPGTAAAKGGNPTSPPPAVPAVQCDFSLDGPTADGGYVFSNQAGDAGCISVVQRNSTLRLYSVQLTPGWAYTVTSNGDGTNSRVEVKFENAATGARVDARIEFGKTWIR